MWLALGLVDYQCVIRERVCSKANLEVFDLCRDSTGTYIYCFFKWNNSCTVQNVLLT